MASSSTNLSIIGPNSLATVYENGNPPYAYGFESASFSQVPVEGTGFSTPLPFTIQSGDEIRISGSEDLVWRINSGWWRTCCKETSNRYWSPSVIKTNTR